MRKILLIVKREYLTRVRKLSFIVTTLLAPIALAVLMLAQIYFLNYSGEKQHIIVKDNSGLTWGKISNSPSGDVNIVYSTASFESLKNSYQDKNYEGVLFIPAIDLNQPEGIIYHSHNLMGIKTKMYIESALSNALEDIKMQKAGISQQTLNNISANVSINQSGRAKDKGGDTIVASAVGYIMAFVIYMIVLIYGTMVMRGVSEEKNSRIVEVIMSSAKPFQLMLGKIIGIGFVGLTQFALWILLGFLAVSIIGVLFQGQLTELSNFANNPSLAPSNDVALAAQSFDNLKSINWLPLLSAFVFYFLGGYFFYAAFFAAIGTAAGEDNESSQSLTYLVTIPIIIAVLISTAIINSPQSSLAIWSSIIPFFSPIVMPARIAFGVPSWQIILSVVSLIIGFVIATWVAAKIYRVGILIYGKKITLRELANWVVYKN